MSRMPSASNVVGAVFLATFREAIRSRLLIAGLAFAALLGLLLAAGASLAIFERQHLVQSVGLSAMATLGMLASIGVASGLFGQALHNGQAATLWVRPLPRSLYVLGRFAGMFAALAVLQLCMAIATAAALIDAGGELGGGFATATLSAVLQMAMVLGLAMVLCCLTRPVSAGVWSCALLLLSLVSDELQQLAGSAGAPLWRGCFALAHAVLPDLGQLKVVGEVINAQPLPKGWWVHAPPYALAYLVACVGACMVLVEARRRP